jgi:hypothetical protein
LLDEFRFGAGTLFLSLSNLLRQPIIRLPTAHFNTLSTGGHRQAFAPVEKKDPPL